MTDHSDEGDEERAREFVGHPYSIKALAKAFRAVRLAERERCARVADERVAMHRESVELWGQSGDVRGETLASAMGGEARWISERIRAGSKAGSDT